MSQFGPSQPPDNPYNPGNYSSGPYQKPGPQAGGPFHQPPRQKGNLTWLWIVLGVGAFGLFSCCGCCMISYFWAVGEDAKLVKSTYENNPVIQQQLGGITTCKVNNAESMTQADDTIWIYDVTGPNGSGKIEVKVRSNFDDVMQIERATLIMENGERFDLD